MKKIVLLLSIVALASCGSGPSTEVKSDSTAVAVDSTKVLDSTSVDSTAVEQIIISIRKRKTHHMMGFFYLRRPLILFTFS
jgi:hypothetical protein